MNDRTIGCCESGINEGWANVSELNGCGEVWTGGHPHANISLVVHTAIWTGGGI